MFLLKYPFFCSITHPHILLPLHIIFPTVAAASGDARRVLAICRCALDLAQKDKERQVTVPHIDRAIMELFNTP